MKQTKNKIRERKPGKRHERLERTSAHGYQPSLVVLWVDGVTTTVNKPVSVLDPFFRLSLR